MNMRVLTYATALLVLLGTFGCRDDTPFLHVHNADLHRRGRTVMLRGVALMDDTTLWRKDAVTPNESILRERDYAFAALGEINAVRLAVKMDYFIDSKGNPRRSGFVFLDRQLARAARHNLLVIIDMHIPPGGAVQDYHATAANQRFWKNEALQERFIHGWSVIARRYADDARIGAYELMNEPAGPAEAYWQLMEKTVSNMRRYDENHAIIIQATRDASIQPIHDDNIIYSFHFYEPRAFTHQNVHWNSAYRSKTPKTYADSNAKTDIVKNIAYAAEQARKLGVPIILGEFGVSTAAPEASIRSWLRDVMQAVKEQRLDGYLYWRQSDPGAKDLTQPKNATMAIINAGAYFSPAQFFGIRPEFAQKHPDFDARAFFMHYTPRPRRNGSTT